MLNTQQILHQSEAAQTLIPSYSTFISRSATASKPLWPRPSFPPRSKGGLTIRHIPNSIKVSMPAYTEKSTSVKAVVTVLVTVGGALSNLGFSRGLDDIADLLGKSILLELVSADLDEETGLEKQTIECYAHRASEHKREVKYECNFDIPEDFGEVGAILIENEHHKEMFIKNIELDGFPNGPINVACNSWVSSKFDLPERRIFFTNKIISLKLADITNEIVEKRMILIQLDQIPTGTKTKQSYLPLQTPKGLKRMREMELATLRGNSKGERKVHDRIYDYDVYNDLGNPDANIMLKRPVLGGEALPYPRRCRTGRAPCKTDPSSESRTNTIYVPRDEAFSEAKELTFSANTLYCLMHALVPWLNSAIGDPQLGFSVFSSIDMLFQEGVNLPKDSSNGALKDFLPRLVKVFTGAEAGVLRFESPAILQRDKFSWFRDDEFSRQTLAGLNPCTIQLVTEWPPVSKLDPEIYGPAESAITTELIDKEIGITMSVYEALKNKKLFMLDYHDLLLPFVNKVRENKWTAFYGSRTLFFLTPDDTLRPLVIELTRPPGEGKPQWKQAFTPSFDATGCWLWRIAKAHVLAHDSGYHQLVSHWLRSHCATEPYIIATNRQLSAMHPIYRLLHPYFRYTIEINSLARESLINAGGIIETSFAPRNYSLEICSAAYDKQWRFDYQALPADLISRGMAVEDPSAPHGLKLTIQDYPFANDGLLIWDAIKEWVTDYVNHYYSQVTVASDIELQAWWTEIRTVGHGDKKDEPWWPELNTREDLIGILSTIIWVTSGHHAAVNFGQYHYAGYFPNRPTITRTKMPTEDPTENEWKEFLHRPEDALLKCFPSQVQATTVMAVLDVLSNHSPDEEYIGEVIEGSWNENPFIRAAFERFSGKLKEIEGIIDGRNLDTNLKNRCGAGVVPYELLKPTSEPGVTGRGVPNSISI